jgi:hypothetical protein
MVQKDNTGRRRGGTAMDTNNGRSRGERRREKGEGRTMREAMDIFIWFAPGKSVDVMSQGRDIENFFSPSFFLTGTHLLFTYRVNPNKTYWWRKWKEGRRRWKKKEL